MQKKLLVVAAAFMACGAVFAPGAAHAVEPVPNTYADVSVPLLAEWLGVNALVVDGDVPDGRTYLYPDAATRDLDTEGSGTGSVAYITWDLDDGSGRAPGIQVVNDDLDFPTQNCIMASGEREADDFPGTIVPKTCSDNPGSSKRLFLEMTQADAPIDLVFSTGTGIIRYAGVRDPELDGGEALDEFRDEYGIGRIYRMILKARNETGERLVGVEVQIGTGVGDDFVTLDFDDDGVAFEMRESVPRPFFVGRTGAGPREVWNPENFAAFAPKLFHDGTGRFDPGFFDVMRAGLFPPQDFQEGDTSAFIYSGEDLNEDSGEGSGGSGEGSGEGSGAPFYDRAGIYGAVTPNYFDMASAQAAGTDFTGFAFGYFLPSTIAPIVIGRYDGGDPLAESDAIEAWWDGSAWRYGVDLDFAEVSPSQLQQWAALLLGLDNSNPEVGPERYGTVLSDDLAGMNMDVFIRLDERLLDEAGVPRYETLTFRIIPVSVEAAGLESEPGAADPLWAQEGNEAPPLSSYMVATGVPVALNDYAFTMRNTAVDIDVVANDLLDGGAVPNEGNTSVAVVDDPANGEVSVDPVTLVVTYTPDEFYAGPDSFTYTVTVDDGGAAVSNVATVSLDVIAPPDPSVPVARNDAAVTFETEPVVIDVIANDTVEGAPVAGAESVEVVIIDAPFSGEAVVNEDNTVTYTAASDATFPLIERFTYAVIVDGAQSNSALVTVRADAAIPEILPIAVDDAATTTTSEPVVIAVLDNDTYDGLAVPEGAVVSVVTEPLNGSAVVGTDGTITYTANEGFVGNDSFTYQVDVDSYVSLPGTVLVTVEADPVETAELVANDDATSTTTTEPVAINVLGNDTVDDDAVPAGAVVTLVTDPANGTAVVESNGSVTYTAEEGFEGDDSFTYEFAVDGETSNVATVTVAVVGEETPLPVAADDTASTTTSEAVVIAVLANDSYDGNPIPGSATVTIVSQPASGTASINADNTVTYTADAEFVGEDTFTYQVTVDGLVSNTATVTVTVDADDDGDIDIKGGSGGCDGCSSTGTPTAPFGVLVLLAGLLVLRRRTLTV